MGSRKVQLKKFGLFGSAVYKMHTGKPYIHNEGRCIYKNENLEFKYLNIPDKLYTCTRILS